jgi:hypothetical protein
MNNQRGMFTLYLIEDELGQVRVVSDYSGTGERCLSMGVELMQMLTAIQPFTDGGLSLVMPCRTDVEH